MVDTAAIKKLKALITIRVAFVTLLLGSFFILQIGYKSFPFPRATSNLIATLYFLTIVYSVLLAYVKRYTIFTYIQLFIDVLATNILIYLTGGIESWFSFILLLIVISASVVLNKKAGYVIATFSSIVYGTMLDLQYYNILPITYDKALTEKDFLYNIFAHITAIYLVAFLSGHLSSRLEKTTKKLEQTDATLKELALFNKELIENIPSGIFTTDNAGTVMIFNKAAENITGLSSSAALGKNIRTIFPFIEQINSIERAENIIKHPKEGDKIIGLTISTLKDTHNNQTGFIGIFQDITQFKMMEQDIKQKEKLATIGELSANIAHEIRNPLASLKGSIEMLKEGKLIHQHKEKLMGIALKEMDRLNNIITDFLNYSRPKKPDFKYFDLNSVLNDTLDLLKNMAVTRMDVSIKKDFDGELNVTADPKKLQQVFWNLGMNAIEAMHSGGELKVSTKKGVDCIEIIFQDSGNGIPEETIGKIFYPFFTTKEEGTGLGLSIAHRIIEEHNGKISVISKSEVGTTFKVILPNNNGKSQ